MEFNITHHYSGHSDILASFPTLEEAKGEFDRLVREWGEPDPSDQFLELWSTDGEWEFTEIEDHALIDPDEWECDD